MGTTSATVRGLRVAELAGALGLSPDTIRYYERAGLLPPPPRTPAGYRAYGAGAVDRLRFIQGAQRLRLKLRDIADLLAIRDTGVCPCEPAERLLRRRLAELDDEMARLAMLRAEMVAMIEALPWASYPPLSPGMWCPPATGGGDLACVGCSSCPAAATIQTARPTATAAAADRRIAVSAVARRACRRTTMQPAAFGRPRQSGQAGEGPQRELGRRPRRRRRPVRTRDRHPGRRTPHRQPSPTATTALLTLAKADTILLWDLDNHTLIAANIVGTWLTTTGVTGATVTTAS